MRQVTSTRKLVPGPIALFGSGETSPSGRKIFNQLFKRLPDAPGVAILETPAGFELNSPQVAGRVGEFLALRLQNYSPQIQLIPARKRGTSFSPDDPELAAPILESALIFMGPGSPTYAVRQLRGSVTWDYLVARHRLGGGIALASAATIAIGAFALPVYEIYKVGEDPHWQKGLDFFAPFGLSLVFVPHWNNTDGGEDLDTSRCFVGRERFDPLLDELPPEVTIVGIDESTGLIFDFRSFTCHVVGRGSITVIPHETAAGYRHEKIIKKKSIFSLDELGDFRLPEPNEGLSEGAWSKASQVEKSLMKGNMPSEQVVSLVAEREAAREKSAWQEADALRDRIEDLGWQVTDTKDGPRIEKRENHKNDHP